MATWGCIQRKSILRVLLPKQSFKEKSCSLCFGFWVSALEVVFFVFAWSEPGELMVLAVAHGGCRVTGWRSWLWLRYVVSFISLLSLAYTRMQKHNPPLNTDCMNDWCCFRVWKVTPRTCILFIAQQGATSVRQTSSCRQIYTIMCLTRLLLSKDFPDDFMTSSFRSCGHLNYGHY